MQNSRRQVAEAGLAFLGPSPEVIKTFGLKHEARAIAESQNVPVLRGTDILPDLAAARPPRSRLDIRCC